MEKFLYGILSLLLSCLFSSAYAIQVDKIIAFGDSMTDNGNIFRLTSNAHKVIPAIPVIPKDPPYYQGRFTNGPNWIDNLSTAMNIPLEDYAYGGSWAEPIIDSKINVPFGLNVQVSYYLVKASLDTHKDQHLYVIWTGANDYINDRPDPDYATDKAVETIRKEIEWLIYYGAKNFYIINVPDISISPEVASHGKDYALRISQMTEMHNRKLASMLRKLQRLNQDTKIIMGDTTKPITDIITNPAKYHLRNVTDACYGGGYWLKNKFMNTEEVASFNKINLNVADSPSLSEVYRMSKLADTGANNICANPDEYLFWDHLHPSQKLHNIISHLALKRLHENDITS